jgi:hypothetical protein
MCDNSIIVNKDCVLTVICNKKSYSVQLELSTQECWYIWFEGMFRKGLYEKFKKTVYECLIENKCGFFLLPSQCYFRMDRRKGCEM